MSYTRQPAHWKTDTAGRKSFERRIRGVLAADREFVLLDSTDSYDEIDFELGFRGRRLFLEVKEKKQRYREAWVEAGGIPEADLFILDELAARRLVLKAPRAYLLVNDHLGERYCIAGALDLVSMPKARVNRSIEDEVATFKGKWLVDLVNMEPAGSLEEAIAYLKRRLGGEDDYWNALACHGRYRGENVPRL